MCLGCNILRHCLFWYSSFIDRCTREKLKGEWQSWKKVLALLLPLLSTGKNWEEHFPLFMLNRHLLSKRKNINSKWCELLDYTFLESKARKCWKLSQPQAPSHKPCFLQQHRFTRPSVVLLSTLTQSLPITHSSSTTVFNKTIYLNLALQGWHLGL